MNSSKHRWRALFDIAEAPRISFGYADLPQKVRDTAGEMSLSGVQIKASMRLNRKTMELEIAPRAGTHILKPSPAEFPGLAEIENLCMDIAENIGLQVPAHGLLPMADGALAYVIKRFDRRDDGTKIHKEDMAQALSMPVTAKYEGSLEKIGKAIRNYSSRPFLDLGDFFERVIFSFIIGNGDMHLKNWALLTEREDNKPFTRLAPCYDFVSSRLYIPDDAESALPMAGRKNRLSRKDFENLAAAIKIAPTAATASMDRLIQAESQFLKMIMAAGLPAERGEAFRALVSSRIKRLAGNTPIATSTASSEPAKEIPQSHHEVGEPAAQPIVPLQIPEWVIKERPEAFSLMDAHMPRKGFMEFISWLPKGGINATLFDLKEAAEKSQINTFGWPIGIVLSIDGSQPEPYNDGVRAIVRTKREDGPTFDYWNVKQNGDYYLMKSLFEDLRSEGKLFIDTRIVRVTETLLHTVRMYRALNAPPASPVRMQFFHGGLKGRELSKAGAIFFPTGGQRSSTDEVITPIEERLDKIEERLHELVYEVISQITVRFNFFKPSRTGLIDPMVDRFLQGRIG